MRNGAASLLPPLLALHFKLARNADSDWRARTNHAPGHEYPPMGIAVSPTQCDTRPFPFHHPQHKSGALPLTHTKRNVPGELYECTSFSAVTITTSEVSEVK